MAPLQYACTIGARAEFWWSLGQAQGQGWGLERGRGSELLANHPIGGSFLGLPGLQELLGNGLEGLWVGSGINRTTEAFNLKLLADRQLHGLGNRRTGEVSHHFGQEYLTNIKVSRLPRKPVVPATR